MNKQLHPEYLARLRAKLLRRQDRGITGYPAWIDVPRMLSLLIHIDTQAKKIDELEHQIKTTTEHPTSERLYKELADAFQTTANEHADTIQRIADLHQCERRYQREGAEDAGSFDTPAQVIREHEDGTEEDDNIKITYFEICAECGRHESAYARTAGLGGDDWGYETAMWPCATTKTLDGAPE